MCKICEHLTSTKSPIQVTCYWKENNRTSCITANLSKCTIAIMDECGRVAEEIPWTRCPVCGEPLKKVENG